MIQDEFTFETYTFSTWQWWVMIREHHMFNSITNMQDSEATNTSFAGPHPSISSNISETTTEGSLAMPKSASLARGRTSYSEGVTWEVLLVLLPWIGWNPDAPCMDCIYIYIGKIWYILPTLCNQSQPNLVYTRSIWACYFLFLITCHTHNRNLNRSYWIKWASQWKMHMSCEILALFFLMAPLVLNVFLQVGWVARWGQNTWHGWRTTKR